MRDQLRKVAPHQGFTAGEADLVDPERGGDPDEALDFLEGQEFSAREEADRLRHAVEVAANITAVGDADPQVVVDPAEGVNEAI